MSIDPTQFNEEHAKRYARLDLIKRILIVFISLIVTAMFAYNIWTTSLIRETQKTNSDTNSTIKDCVTPGGECYQNSQKNQQGAIDQIGAIIILANACADEEGTQELAVIQKCVMDNIEKAVPPE